jgi:squalene-hopene/tetraprenyl-beta-curcumene cyclase
MTGPHRSNPVPPTPAPGSAPRPDPEALGRTLAAARKKLLESRTPKGHWEGHLSSSALSTATAICALEAVRRRRAEASPSLESLVRRGLEWLVRHQNADGGYGDTTDSPSNLSTTALSWAVLGLGKESAAGSRAEAWLKKEAPDLSPGALALAIGRRYGEDRTFSVPILMMCAISGRFGEGPEAWSAIPRLPFELAALPRFLFGWLGLRVVSYALPALIAIGQALHHHHPTRNPWALLMRTLTRGKTLRLLEALQPESGGFLEATPLTSFVTMALASSGRAEHPVAEKGVEFLVRSAREDGSWAIDTNLATWVSTLALEALATDGKVREPLGSQDRQALRHWLLHQQTKVPHPYTGAAAGGWAWTDQSGGVPDADDTPGALLALSLLLEGEDRPLQHAADQGALWLVGLQNRDGGIPTFCRGWGQLPFDRSCPDLTAHALRAWSAWRAHLPRETRRSVDPAMDRARSYLIRAQSREGFWVPLWFGSQGSPDQTNPVYGTTRVMLSAGVAPTDEAWNRAHARASAWLLSVQNSDGGFGGAQGLPSTIEETALAVEALAGVPGAPAAQAAGRGAQWLVERTAAGTSFPASPIGLYFAKLWYWETLYPIIFTVSALSRISA